MPNCRSTSCCRERERASKLSPPKREHNKSEHVLHPMTVDPSPAVHAASGKQHSTERLHLRPVCSMMWKRWLLVRPVLGSQFHRLPVCCIEFTLFAMSAVRQDPLAFDDVQNGASQGGGIAANLRCDLCCKSPEDFSTWLHSVHSCFHYHPCSCHL
eukprot:6471264-Amphidinium_carterae.2